jgi:hypothetical protein
VGERGGRVNATQFGNQASTIVRNNAVHGEAGVPEEEWG